MTTEERRSLIREKHRSGATRKELAAEFGISVNAISAAINDTYARRPVPSKRSQFGSARVVELWNQGMSVNHIAERLSVSPASVNRTLIRAGVDRKGMRRFAYESLGGGGTARQGLQRVARRT